MDHRRGRRGLDLTRRTRDDEGAGQPPVTGGARVVEPAAVRAVELPDRPAGSAVDSWLTARGWLLLHLVTLAVAAVLLVVVNRGQWFFKDDWDPLTRRVHLRLPGDLSVWAPHNGHWSTLPVLVFRGLFDVFGLTSYWPWVVVLIAIHLLSVHLAWRLFLRLGAGAVCATATAAVLAVLGSGGEDLLWAFQIGFDGAVAGAMACALLLVRERFGSREVVGTWVSAVAALMCSGIALPLLVLPGLICLWRHRVLRTALAFSVPAAAYVAWSLLAGGTPVRGVSTAGQFLTYVLTGLWDSTAAATGSRVGPLVVVAVVVAALVVSRRRAIGERAPVVVVSVVSAVTVLAVYVSIATGRADLGSTGAGSSRYVHIAAMSGAPMLAVATGVLLRWRPRQLALPLAGLALFALLANVLALQRRADFEQAREQRSHDSVVAAVLLLRAGEPLSDATADPQSGYTDMPSIAALDRRHAFGDVLPRVARPVIDTQRLRLQLVLTDGVAPAGGRPLSAVNAPGSAARPVGACSAVHLTGGGDPQLLVTTAGGPGSVTVTAPVTGQLVAEYLPSRRNRVPSATLTGAVRAGSPVTVRWLSRTGAVRLTFPGPGEVRVCRPGAR